MILNLEIIVNVLLAVFIYKIFLKAVGVTIFNLAMKGKLGSEIKREFLKQFSKRKDEFK